MNLDDLISDEVFTKCSHKISLKACEYHLASGEVKKAIEICFKVEENGKENTYVFPVALDCMKQVALESLVAIEELKHGLKGDEEYDS